MKISEIGDNFHKDYISSIAYFSDDYLLDADILIIDLNKIRKELELQTLGDDERKSEWFTKETYEYIKAKVGERKRQLSDYFNNGGNLWLRLPENKNLYFHVEKSHADYQEVIIDLFDLVNLDGEDFILDRKKGSNITFTEPMFDVFFKEFQTSYNFSFSRYKGKAIAQIGSSRLPVSIVVSKSRGNIILMPEISVGADSWEDFESRVFYIAKAFEKIDAELKSQYKNIPDVHIPDWCKSYHLSNEHAQLTKLNKYYEDRDLILNKIEQQQLLLSRYTELKELLFATGRTLEDRAKYVFKAFGYELLHAEDNREDLIIKHKADVAVVEVKGQKGSAAEHNATQLMKWVTSYHHDHQVKPKGILIVNTFKDKPFLDRTEAAFPDQMLDYCRKMELSLLTSAQLLGLYLDFKNNELNLKRIHSLLWEAIGPLDYIPTKIFSE